MLSAPSVSRTAQQGLSLIELMISSALALVILGSVVSVFLSGQLNSQKRSLDLMVSQNMASNMQILVEDIQRAGHGDLGTVTLKNSTDIVDVDLTGTEKWLAFALRRKYIDGAGDICHQYESIRYVFKQDNLWYCVVKSAAPDPCAGATIEPEIATNIGSCKRLFDEKNIKIVDFQVTQDDAISNSAAAERLTVSLTGESLSDSSVNYKLDRQVFVRNAK